MTGFQTRFLCCPEYLGASVRVRRRGEGWKYQSPIILQPNHFHFCLNNVLSIHMKFHWMYVCFSVYMCVYIVYMCVYIVYIHISTCLFMRGGEFHIQRRCHLDSPLLSTYLYIYIYLRESERDRSVYYKIYHTYEYRCMYTSVYFVQLQN